MTGSKCSVPRCSKRPALITLYAVDGPFLFCAQCAAYYESKGYRRQPFPKSRVA